MTEGGISTEGQAIATVPKEQSLNPEHVRSTAERFRQQLEQVVLGKGLLQPSQKVVSGERTYDHRKRVFQDFIIPEQVKEALKTNPVYKVFHGGVTGVQVFSDNGGNPVAEIRFWDDQVKGEKAIHFSVGTSNPGNERRTLAFFPANRNVKPELCYVYSSDKKKPADHSNTSRPAIFSQMEPELQGALDRLKRFPDTFKPSRTQRIIEAIRSAVPSKR